MSIFKEKDRVFHFSSGWGTITEVLNEECVLVIFDNNNGTTTTVSGTNVHLLSFTEYTLLDGGFSQQRPKPEIEKGTVIYVKYNTSRYWHIGTFDDWNDKGNIGITDLDGITRYFPEYSLENPLK